MLTPANPPAITPAQIRAGRGLLKWTQGVLAHRASISAVTLNMIESDQVAPRTKTLAAIRSVLEGEGIRFIGDESEGFGVVMRPRADASRRPGAQEPQQEPQAAKTSRSMRAAE
ncbi:helix-turn-helix domain-containing protein [Methylorubrum sp. B1-46]|uniref:helix-turn-helix domain-containing protein n=1 Tax=Methylorubrum sp. B1-46 TaxID=2897334 RepID=UPI001E417981|nr:helix-turn-helix transcriptional regulator [Methylorubrum sp. B1-46]UGB25750.1 helix-turn-helix domain-containing protein [Methylorubrum sp. B1-46]